MHRGAACGCRRDGSQFGGPEVTIRRLSFHTVIVLGLLALPLAVGDGGPVVHAAETVRDLAAATPQSVGIDPERVKRIDAFMKSWIDQGRLSAIVTTLSRHGKVVHVTAHGKKDIRTTDPIAADSIFRIYSMTKPVTGVAMMMPYEEGKWRLSVHVGENADGSLNLECALGLQQRC